MPKRKTEAAAFKHKPGEAWGVVRDDGSLADFVGFFKEDVAKYGRPTVRVTIVATSDYRKLLKKARGK